MGACPYCLEQIKEGARKCPHCQSSLVQLPSDGENTIFVADKGLIRFAKFAAAVFALFAFVLYTTLGYRLSDLIKEMDEKSKLISNMYSSIRDTSLVAREKALDDQKELTRLTDEFEKQGNGFKEAITIKLREMENIKSGVEKIGSDVEEIKDQSSDLLTQATSEINKIKEARDDAFSIRKQIELTQLAVNQQSVKINQQSIKITQMPKPSQEISRAKLWNSGTKIQVYFINGDRQLQDEVLSTAAEWSRFANITFMKVQTPKEANIRVTFAGNGNWSYVGTDHLLIPKDFPTMTLSKIPGADPQARSGDILHEFGHVLGFFHEHNSPHSTIAWNIPAMQSVLGLSLSEIDTFINASVAMPCGRPFDPKSVMMVPIKKEMTLNNQEFIPSTELSESDKTCARQMYPK
jgi:hypothetical protein